MVDVELVVMVSKNSSCSSDVALIAYGIATSWCGLRVVLLDVGLRLWADRTVEVVVVVVVRYWLAVFVDHERNFRLVTVSCSAHERLQHLRIGQHSFQQVQTFFVFQQCEQRFQIEHKITAANFVEKLVQISTSFTIAKAHFRQVEHVEKIKNATILRLQVDTEIFEQRIQIKISWKKIFLIRLRRIRNAPKWLTCRVRFTFSFFHFLKQNFSGCKLVKADNILVFIHLNHPVSSTFGGKEKRDLHF
ncbi:hypothetical protein T02_4433 [Trichinella nativa]|uniref:Uncharacterized protein n=1 Tax=Trichinella nativa TaxID=6335 RepID=A0A0V1L0I4_9BILA|nr:hypothetical protein T02_4433 [Trichinella nativa]